MQASMLADEIERTEGIRIDYVISDKSPVVEMWVPGTGEVFTITDKARA